MFFDVRSDITIKNFPRTRAFVIAAKDQFPEFYFLLDCHLLLILEKFLLEFCAALVWLFLCFSRLREERSLLICRKIKLQF